MCTADAEVQNILTDVVDTAVPLGLENHLMECTNMLQTISYADLVDDCGLADLVSGAQLRHAVCDMRMS